MEKPVPEFAIFQNSRTKKSAMWVKETGVWKDFPERDFGALLIMANMLRHSPNPKETLDEIAKAINSLKNE